MDNITKLRNERDTKAKEARNILDDTTGGYDAAKVDACYARIEQIDAQIKQEQKALDIDARLASEANDPDRGPQAPEARQEQRPGDEVRSLVFQAYLRGGEAAVNRLPESVINDYAREVQNAQSTGTDSEGGYLVPTTFGGKLIEALKKRGGMRAVADVQRTATGNDIQWPTVDETAVDGEWLAENAGAADGDAVFGTVSIKAHLASSKVITIPLALLQDNGIEDLEGMILRLLAARLGRTGNKGFTTGDGTGKPFGVVTDSLLGHTTAGGLVASFGYDDFVELKHSVDPAYRENGARWMFSDTVLKIATKLKDGNGRPLWLPGVSGEVPAEILDHAYTINQDVAVPSAGSKSMLFGDFKKYLIRDVMDVQFHRFTDSAYAKKGQVGFMALMRTDGKLLDGGGGAVKHMAQAAV